MCVYLSIYIYIYVYIYIHIIYVYVYTHMRVSYVCIVSFSEARRAFSAALEKKADAKMFGGQVSAT